MLRNIEDRIFSITGPDAADVEVVCPQCKAADYVTITEDEADRLIDGELVQNVLPHRSAVERERLISGTCPACQGALVVTG